MKTKQGIDRTSEIVYNMPVIRKNRSCSNYQSHFSLFAGFKRELTQVSDEYNLAIWAVNLFDMLDFNI